MQKISQVKQVPNLLPPTYPHPLPATASLTYPVLIRSPRSLCVSPPTSTSLSTGLLFSRLIHRVFPWPETSYTGLGPTDSNWLYSCYYTHAGSLHQFVSQSQRLHTSQPCNNDGCCRRSFHCALSLSHVWRIKGNAIVRCHCSAIAKHIAVVILVRLSHRVSKHLLLLPDTRFATATFTN